MINHQDSFKMDTMKKIFYILFVFCSITTLFAQKKVSVKQAHSLFDRKSYVKAAEAYEQCEQSQKVLQNLGDCYYYNFQMNNAVRAYGQLFFTYKDSVKKEVYFRYANALKGIKDFDKMPIPEDIFQPQAERRVRLGLVVAELVKANSLHAKSEQVSSHIEELAASYEKPEDVARWYFGDRQRLAEVEAVVIENNVTEFVLGKAKVSDKAVSFDELMGQA